METIVINYAKIKPQIPSLCLPFYRLMYPSVRPILQAACLHDAPNQSNLSLQSVSYLPSPIKQYKWGDP